MSIDDLLPLTASPALASWLVERNVRLAGWWAQRVRKRRRIHPGTTDDDLYSEGLVGLVVASQRYDFSRGVQFATYASWWIFQAIGRFVDVDHVIRPHSAEPHTAVLPVSLDAPTKEADNSRRGMHSLGDLLPAKPERDAGDNLDTLAALDLAFSALSPRERDVIRLRHLEGLTLDQTAAKLGVSKERIRQNQNTAMVRMRKRLGIPDIDDPGLHRSRCKWCGDWFQHVQPERDYCSRRCVNSSKRGKPWGKPLKREVSP